LQTQISAGALDKIFSRNSTETKFIKGLNSYSDLDLGDSKLVKVLQIPYCPSAIRIEDGVTKIDSAFDPDTWKYQSLRSKFKAALDPKTLSAFSYTLPVSTAKQRVLYSKSMNLEPKLYHSDFYTYKLVYDGAYKAINFEDIVPTSTTDAPELKVTFMATNTIGSSIAFMYDIDKATTTFDCDFPVLISARDNSLPIYNNDYINYMRYTYAADRNNIDATQKAKEISIGLGAASTAVSTVGGAAIGFATGHVPGAVIGAVVGAATGIISTINAAQQADTNIANANRSLDSKIANLKNQPVTASGASSAVDIMTEYSGNALYAMTYEPSELLKSAIYDKLFYCGYAHPVQEVPDFDSRFWFNYVQCTPVFSGSTLTYSIILRRY
jgi:hypothetical protein